jgi:dolichol-phosphate mannosyltransferase
MRYDDTTVVLPTINEAESIGKLIGYLSKNFQGIRVLVVDDGSTDSTPEIVRRISKRNGSVRFFDRARRGLKRGLTSSIVDGIRESKTRFVIVMDADLQHPPNKIAAIKRGLERGCRLVVAVRVDVSRWELYRKIISKLLMHTGDVVLFLRGGSGCKDIFSGYFGVERAFFDRTFDANKKRFVMEGYKVLFDLLKSVPNGSVEICEVPYAFNARKGGSSKASFRQGIRVLRSFMS